MSRSKRNRGPSGSRPENVLNIAEIPYESGAVRFRFARYMSADGMQWVRHGPFVAYHEDGEIASEGQYVDGLEQGEWHDYHDNGQLAAKGCYIDGKEHGYWQFWAPDGTEEDPVEYDHGEEVT